MNLQFSCLLHCCVLCVLLIFVLPGPEFVGAEDGSIDEIKFINNPSEPFKAELVPDPSYGSVPHQDTSYTKFSINDEQNSFSLSPSSAGKAQLSGSLPGLAEGKYDASAQTLTPSKSLKDAAQLLFIVDTTPPELTFVSPLSNEIPISSIPFVFSFSDTGSGVETVDNAGLTVASINGEAIEAEMTSYPDGSGDIVITPHERLETGSDFSLVLTLEDRAGNQTTFAKIITLQPKTAHQYDHRCPSYLGGYVNQSDLVVHLPPSPLIMDLPNTEYYLKVSFQRYVNTHDNSDAIVLSEVLWRQFTIESEDSSGLHVEKIKFDPAHINTVVFKLRLLSQNIDKSILKLTYPKSFEITSENPLCAEDREDDLEWENYLRNDSFDLQTAIIPVQIRREYRPSVRVEPIGKKLIATDETTPFSVLDPKTSWFEVNGTKYWFEDVATADAPAKEGYNDFTINIGNKISTWSEISTSDVTLSEDKRYFQHSGRLLVPFEPPEIVNFSYNRELLQFEAQIRDDGTPLPELSIALFCPGQPSIPFDFDDDTGTLTAPFPVSDSVIEATLTVEDNARQRTTAEINVFGALADDPDDPSSEITATSQQSLSSYLGPAENQPAIPPLLAQALEDNSPGSLIQSRGDFIAETLASYSDVEYCGDIHDEENEFKHPSRSFDYSPPYTLDQWPEDRIEETATIISPLKNNGVYEIIQCTQRYTCRIGQSNLAGVTWKEDYLKYCADRNQSLLHLCEAETWQECSENWQEARNSDVPGISLTKAPAPIPCQFNGRYVKYYQPLACETREVDLSPPVISNVSYNNETGEISADIHDHGAPVTGLTTSLILQSVVKIPNSTGGYATYRDGNRIISNSTFAIGTDQKTGHFSGLHTEPGPELYALAIRATDRAGNTSTVPLYISNPLSPPEATLTLLETAGSGKSLKMEGEDINAYLLGEAWDESGIVHEKTRFHIDNQLIPYFGTKPFDWQGYQERTLASYDYKDLYRLNYGVFVDEGSHHARFRVTDHSGYSSEATLQFDLTFIPEIFNFKALPDAVQQQGGPMFSALIIDAGNDLGLKNITFSLDNKVIPQNALYYDPVSGYFSVTGPLVLATGIHRARINVIDDNGHPAEKTLRFFVGDQIIAAADSSAQLNIDSYSIWEIRNQNNDGQANPGETIRLFLSLTNNAPFPIDNCRGLLTAEDDRITIEDLGVYYAELKPNTPTMPLRGFELTIDADILDTTIADPYETNLDLQLNCNGDMNWDLPFQLPIYKPTLPASVSSSITVELDRLPHSTDKSEITISGTALSSHSRIDQIVVLVNGVEVPVLFFDANSGEFEALTPLDPGTNNIEVQAFDQAGANGFAHAFVASNSSVQVTLDHLPASTSSPLLSLSGSARSSASVITSIALRVNGSRVPLDWSSSDTRFQAEITLTPGANRIEVEAQDEAGSIGFAAARIAFESRIMVRLNSLPRSTEDDSLVVTGRAESSGSKITDVSVFNNGQAYATSYNSGTKQFSATVDLVDGGNPISVQARDQNGRTGNDSGFVTKTASFSSPSIRLTNPSNGDFYQCGEVYAQGTYEPGSSELESIMVSIERFETDGEGSSGYVPVATCPATTSGTNFTSSCNIIRDWGGDYRLRATIRTSGGQASDTLSYTLGDCS